MKEEIISSQLANSILIVYRECSRAVHGEAIPEKDAHAIRELGLKTLVALKEIGRKFAEK